MSKRGWLVERAGVWACVAVAMAVPAAQAQTREQIDWCYKGAQFPADRVIEGCTAVIEAGRISGKDLATPYYVRCEIYRRRKRDYQQALRDCDAAIRLDPRNAKAFNNRGIVYRDLRDWDRALADLNEAIPLDPKFSFAFNNRGNVYLDTKDYDRAIADFSTAIRLDRRYANAFYNRGLAYEAKGDAARARADFSQAVKLR